MKPYEWDFSGHCAPSEDGKSRRFVAYETFTLGIFQWLPKKSGTGLKRGKVQKRVKGYISYPKEAYEKARAIVAEKNFAQFGSKSI